MFFEHTYTIITDLNCLSLKPNIWAGLGTFLLAAFPHCVWTIFSYFIACHNFLLKLDILLTNNIL